MASNQQTPPSGNDVAGSAFFKKFLGSAEGYIKQPSRMKKLLTDAYHKASEKKDVGTLAHEAWDTLQTLFRLIKASMAGEYTGVPGTTIAAAAAVLIYFLSPIDLIPDIIPVIGLLDDVALLAWFWNTFKTEVDRFHEWENTRPVLAVNNDRAAAERTASHMSGSVSPNAAEHPQPAGESAKQHGTADLPRTSPAHDAAGASTGPASASRGGAQLAPESAKQHGTADLPRTSPAHSSPNTDSGLGSPDSSSPRPVHEAGPDATPTSTTSGPTVRAWEGSRNATDAGNLDTGGNVR